MNDNTSLLPSSIDRVTAQPIPDLNRPFAGGVDAWLSLVRGTTRADWLRSYLPELRAAGVVVKRGRKLLGVPREVVDFLLGRCAGPTSRRNARR